MSTSSAVSHPELAVQQRYSAAAQAREESLCCPLEYPTELLQIIPQEILERDYGCGDPTSHIHPGDTVLDLGSGGGKLCYITAQVVGPEGRVIGVDCNREMLALARKYREQVANMLGYANVDFRYGLIQDLSLDLDRLADELAARPVRDPAAWLELRQVEDRLRREHPLIASDSVDCVVSNCVLNLVRQQDRQQLFREIFRVLRPGGRAAISDIVADEDVPAHLQGDAELWSGCISGAFREDRFLEAFAEAGFHGIEITKRQAEPWRTVAGIEFRSVTVVAYKGTAGPELDRQQAVIYRGPFAQVEDERGRVYLRGERMAVGDVTFQRLQQDPYAGLFDFISPRAAVSADQARPFEKQAGTIRTPRETKGAVFSLTTLAPESCCGPESSCCG
jgi:SAM-dependent methyltransferase